jgi:hypothetical protein
MMEDNEVLRIWGVLNDAFNAGDLDAWAPYFDDSFTGMASETYMGSREEFMQAARNGRANGWTGQRMVSVSARNNLLTARYYNEFADGTRTEGAGIVLFNDHGKIVAVRALNNSGATPMSPSP